MPHRGSLGSADVINLFRSYYRIYPLLSAFSGLRSSRNALATNTIARAVAPKMSAPNNLLTSGLQAEGIYDKINEALTSASVDFYDNLPTSELQAEGIYERIHGASSTTVIDYDMSGTLSDQLASPTVDHAYVELLTCLPFVT